MSRNDALVDGASNFRDIAEWLDRCDERVRRRARDQRRESEMQVRDVGGRTILFHNLRERSAKIAR